MKAKKKGKVDELLKRLDDSSSKAKPQIAPEDSRDHGERKHGAKTVPQRKGDEPSILGYEKGGKVKAKKDACYHKVKARYKVWPSAYASGALVRCRKVGAKNWGNKSKG